VTMYITKSICIVFRSSTLHNHIIVVSFKARNYNLILLVCILSQFGVSRASVTDILDEFEGGWCCFKPYSGILCKLRLSLMVLNLPVQVIICIYVGRAVRIFVRC
jgi:hypothetical protein